MARLKSEASTHRVENAKTAFRVRFGLKQNVLVTAKLMDRFQVRITTATGEWAVYDCSPAFNRNRIVNGSKPSAKMSQKRHPEPNEKPSQRPIWGGNWGKNVATA